MTTCATLRPPTDANRRLTITDFVSFRLRLTTLDRTGGAVGRSSRVRETSFRSVRSEKHTEFREKNYIVRFVRSTPRKVFGFLLLRFYYRFVTIALAIYRTNTIYRPCTRRTAVKPSRRRCNTVERNGRRFATRRLTHLRTDTSVSTTQNGYRNKFPIYGTRHSRGQSRCASSLTETGNAYVHRRPRTSYSTDRRRIQIETIRSISQFRKIPNRGTCCIYC